MNIKNDAERKSDPTDSEFELRDHYLFWEWQYCYRNDLLRAKAEKEGLSFTGKERLTSSIKFSKNLARHWSPRMIKKQVEDGLFDSSRILVDTFNKQLKYNRPNSHETIYHALVFEILDEEHIEDLSRDKGGLIPFDLSGDIDIAALELKLFYYTQIVDDPRNHEDMACAVMIELLNKKIRAFSGYRSFSRDKQDPPRAIGLFLWDHVFSKGFKYGSRASSFDRFSLFMSNKNTKTKSIPSSPDVLKSHYTRTHEQILTREVAPMTSPKATNRTTPK